MGEESAPTIVPATKLVENGNEACRRALLEEALLGSSGDSEEDDGEGEPKKQKAVPKEKEDVVPDCEEEEAAPEKEEDRQEAVPDSDEEDSDEIGVATKKGKKLLKYEKLLQKPVPGGKDDGSEEEEPLESRKRKSKSKRVVVSSQDEHEYADSKKPELSSSLGSSSSSESDNLDIEPARKKKKKQASSSIGSSGQSDDSDFNSSKKGKRGPRDGSASPGKAIKKKRRRIKMAASTDDDKENSDDSNSSQETGNKSRKNLRKLRPVGDETRAAAKAEEERKKRVQERQKLQYNKIRGGASECGNTTLEELVLEMDLKANEPLVTVNRKLVKCMKPHQVDGVKFLYECTIESLEMLKKDPNNGSGCILAHCMGLGKTFQVISFLHTVLNHKDCGKILRTALVVCPYNTVLNWSQEFERWLKDKGLDLTKSCLIELVPRLHHGIPSGLPERCRPEDHQEETVHEVSSIKDNHSRVKTLEYWQKKGGVMIIGYDMFRRLTNEKAMGVSKKIKERLRKALLDPGPDIVVCDEGHILKSDKTSLSIAMNSLRTCRRIVLSGTPLQNNLQEYHCMVQFVKPNLLGTKKEFSNRFVNPIANGQCADSTALDVRLMKKRVHVLHRLLNGCVQRCDYNALKPFLPPKCEYVISVRLSEVQVQLYRHFLDHLARGGRNSKPNQGMSLFWDFNVLRNIWTHPALLVMSAERARAKELLKDESSDWMSSFIDDGSESSCIDDGAESSSIDDGSESSSSQSDSNEEAVYLDQDKPSTGKGHVAFCRFDRRDKLRDDYKLRLSIVYDVPHFRNLDNGVVEYVTLYK
ncbi:transcriptional regulator ATRX [Ixodes scapularis]|uniref:transcriptional regulator ATRX n=1 Tax=Ixodes scapularis TaxID=6945 RepID=UPI001A9EDCC5|nr:transcriptional regulator ATRX [Ixodes scapularis]